MYVFFMKDNRKGFDLNIRKVRTLETVIVNDSSHFH